MGDAVEFGETGGRMDAGGGIVGADGRGDRGVDAFVTHRNLLFTVAYEMLGSAADAEDVLQETWLRWADVDLDDGAGPARVPGPDHHPAVAQPAADARPPQGVLRRLRGCPSRC